MPKPSKNYGNNFRQFDQHPYINQYPQMNQHPYMNQHPQMSNLSVNPYTENAGAGVNPYKK